MAFFAQYALELYAVVFLLGWFLLPRRETKKRHALVVAGISGILALVINMIIGGIWFRPRPFTVLPKGTFVQLIPHPPDSSFPSDHVSGGFGFSSASWGRASVAIQWIFTVLTVIVMFARVYVGVHWPTDVLGGMVVGLVSGFVVRRFERFLRPLTRLGLWIFRMGEFAAKEEPKYNN